MSCFPDILGMELHDAEALLEAEGLTFVLVETKAVRGEAPDGTLRVVRVQTPVPGPMVLTVCRV